MANIAEVRVPIMLDKERLMYFNGNSMSAYEEATGKFFMDTVASLYELLRPLTERRQNPDGPANTKINAMDLVRKVPMTDLRALVWAAVHDYDSKDEPHWPLTIKQVGRYITMAKVPEIFTKFLQGQMANTPTKEEMGESPAPPVSGAGSANLPQSETATGGGSTIELPVDAFG